MKNEAPPGSKYLFWLGLVILILLSYYIIQHFILALLSGFILSYLIRPLYLFFSSKMNKHLSAILSVIVIILIIVIPIIFLVRSLVLQITALVNSGAFALLIKNISSLPVFTSDAINLSGIQSQIAGWLVSKITNTVTALPSIVISVFISLFSIYYILTNWDYLVKILTSYLPFKEKEKVSGEIGRATSQIVYGYVFIALLEFIIAFVGFKVAGASFYIVLPFLIALFAFIPLLGPAIVWVPTALYYYLAGEYYTATVIVITGVILSMVIDNILAPKIVGEKARIHPLIMLLGVLGGIPLFGIFGFIIGPLILVYTLKLLNAAFTSHPPE